MTQSDEQLARTVEAGRQDAMLAYRGLLICAIVIGHNRLIVGAWSMLFPLLYFWHVQGFFLEAIGRRGSVHTAARRIPDLLVRYLVPYSIVLGLATAIGIVIKPGETEPALLPLALWNGFAETCEVASGLSLFWFLPTFASFSIVLVLRARIELAWPRLRLTIDIGLILAAIGISLSPSSVAAPWMPLGVLLALYFVPLAFGWRALLTLAERALIARIALLIPAFLVVALQIWAIIGGERINASVYDLGSDFPHVLLAAGSAVAMALIVSSLASCLPGQTCLRICGRYSMVIFLVHPFVQGPSTVILTGALTPFGKAVQVGAGLTVAAISVAFSLIVALAFGRMPRLRSLVLPLDRENWLVAAGLRPSYPKAT